MVIGWLTEVWQTGRVLQEWINSTLIPIQPSQLARNGEIPHNCRVLSIRHWIVNMAHHHALRPYVHTNKVYRGGEGFVYVRVCVCMRACVCVCVCICACVHPCVHACVHDLYCMLCPRPACYKYDLDLHALSLQLHIDQSSDCQYVADVNWGGELHNDRHAMSLHQAVHNGVFSESNSTGMQVN